MPTTTPSAKRFWFAILFVSVLGGVGALGMWAVMNYTESWDGTRSHTPYWGVFLTYVGPALVSAPFLWLWGRCPRFRAATGSVAERLLKWIIWGWGIFLTIVIACFAILLLAPLARRILQFIGIE